VTWVAEAATRRALLLSFALSALLLVLPLDGSANSVTVVGAALAVAISAGLFARAARTDLLTAGAGPSPDAPARDERCRHGAFRRQTNPNARGRVRPRAPQHA